MATTPLWIPLAAAAIAVVGTLGGVIFTQAWNSRLEERRWAREAARLAEAQAREDLYRTYEHRRAAYVDFLVEFERLQHIYQDSDREPTTFDDPAFDSLAERLVAVRVYGTVMAHALARSSSRTVASECLLCL